jgi:glutamate-1-semialdehyde 2,1-aminomutase
VGPVYQAGTLSGNPLAVAAGIAAVAELARPGTYGKLGEKSDYLAEGLQGVFEKSRVATWTNRVGSMWTTFFQRGPVVDYPTAKTSDTALYGKYFNGLLSRGIYIAPSQFEAGFVSLAHARKDLDRTIAAARETLVRISKGQG